MYAQNAPYIFSTQPVIEYESYKHTWGYKFFPNKKVTSSVTNFNSKKWQCQFYLLCLSSKDY